MKTLSQVQVPPQELHQVMETQEVSKGMMAFLKGPKFALFAIILILLSNIRHAVVVYIEITGLGQSDTISQWEYIYMIGMMLAIDVAVVAFTVNGNQAAAKAFAWLIGIINLIYYYLQIGIPESTLQGGVYYFGAVCLSAAWGYAIYYFNEVFVSHLEEDERLETIRGERDTWQKRYNDLQGRVETLKDQQQTQTDTQTILLSRIAGLEGFAKLQADSLRRRRSRALEKLGNGVSPEEKTKYELDILVIDHFLAQSE